MRIGFLLFTIFYIVQCSCPESFELVRDGQCRGLGAITTVDYDNVINDIVSICNRVNGQPLIIHSEEENSYWANWKIAHNDSTQGNWPIAVTCNTETKQWSWVDGSHIDYKPATTGPGLDEECTTGCFWLITPVGSWNKDCLVGFGYSFLTDVFCTTQLQQPSSSVCEYFEDDTDDAVCYQVGSTAESWQDAQMNCKHLGANLASIHNTQENNFVRRLAVSKGAVNGIFLGATESGKGKEFGWIDGTAWDYNNFYPGFPIDGFGDCLAMDTSNSSGLWMNRDCSTKMPVACVRDEGAVAEPTCRTGAWKGGEVMTSPGFPYNASMPCEYFLMAEKGKTVELEIITLEANTCCDNLLIYDDYLTGTLIANITGEVRNATYSSGKQFMRVSWQPNGGVNVRGVAMVFRGV